MTILKFWILSSYQISKSLTNLEANGKIIYPLNGALRRMKGNNRGRRTVYRAGKRKFPSRETVGCGSERDIAHPRATPGSLAARACMHKACTLDGPRTLNSRACVRARQTHFPAARFSRDASPPPSRYFSYTSSFLVSVGFNERIVIRLSVDSSNSKEFEMGTLLFFLQDSLLSSCSRLSRIERGTLSESWSPLEYSSRKMKNFEGSRISKYRYLKKRKKQRGM